MPANRSVASPVSERSTSCRLLYSAAGRPSHGSLMQEYSLLKWSLESSLRARPTPAPA